MSLLFPLYLLGAAAITLPILLHRRRQRPLRRALRGARAGGPAAVTARTDHPRAPL